jgi:small conductance mechanosensitive channel
MIADTQTILRIALTILEKTAQIILIAIPAHILIKIADKILHRFFGWTEFDETLEKFTHKTIITLLWLATIGVTLVVLGVDVNAVIASFGVGSFIIGFALKDTLSNFAAGIVILLNHPFRLGDDIEVKGERGTVKTITMSYTKLITKDKIKIVIPNSIIWGNPIKNHTAYKNL